MSVLVWVGIGVVVYVLVSTYNQMQSEAAVVTTASPTSKMRSRLDAIVVLQPCCTTPEAKAALDVITSCVLQGDA